MRELADRLVGLGMAAEEKAGPRSFHQVCPERRDSCQDDVYVLATPEQARALHDELTGFR